ncbi:MAG: malto-oligosyltrehalose trehalohydrolase [Methylotenera sp.]|nr:malto-oligosyltrehalose trehalohydrolase [Methylotenera sp.]
MQAILKPMTNTFTHKRSLAAGANLIGPNTTTFRIWAPHAAEVQVIFNDQIHGLQQEQEEGWFSAELHCGAGTLYQYRIKNQQGAVLEVPDPASRAQRDSVHTQSIVVDPEAYQWRTLNWKGRPWHETILYELHVGMCGGFTGVKAKLASLAAMGFTAIELMPIASYPGERNWGYDGVLQYAPQYTYGTPDELKELVDEAHALNMSILLDVVYNHFGPDGNYINHYAPHFFSEAHITPWGNAIDFHHPEIRNFYTENVLYWLDEYQFDGLRFDACHAIIDEDWLIEAAQMARNALGKDRHIHLTAENDNNCARMLKNGFDAQWNDDGHHVLHVLLTGETEGYYSDYADNPAAKLARCMAEGFVYQGEHSEHREQDRGECSSDLANTSFILFLQNHDQVGNRPFGERLTTLVSDPALRVANALVLLSPQIPMLFMGEEFGATQPFLYFTSHEDLNLVEAVREGRRKEFSTFSKFADTAFALQIPDPNNTETFLASIPRPFSVEGAVTNSSLDWSQWVSKLLGIRHHYIIPRLDGVRSLKAEAIGPSAVKAYWKMGDGATLAIVINLGSERLILNREEVIKMPDPEILFDYSGVWLSLEKGVLPGLSFIALLEWARA